MGLLNGKDWGRPAHQRARLEGVLVCAKEPCFNRVPVAGAVCTYHYQQARMIGIALVTLGCLLVAYAYLQQKGCLP